MLPHTEVPNSSGHITAQLLGNGRFCCEFQPEGTGLNRDATNMFLLTSNQALFFFEFEAQIFFDWCPNKCVWSVARVARRVPPFDSSLTSGLVVSHPSRFGSDWVRDCSLQAVFDSGLWSACNVATNGTGQEEPPADHGRCEKVSESFVPTSHCGSGTSVGHVGRPLGKLSTVRLAKPTLGLDGSLGYSKGQAIYAYVKWKINIL